MQRPGHIPVDTVLLRVVCFDMVRNSAWECGCNPHHDSCSLRRVFVHPHNPEQFIPPHSSVTFTPFHWLTAGPTFCLGELSGRRRIPHFHSRYFPVFFFSTGGPCGCLVIMPSAGCLSIGSLASRVSTSRIVTSTANYPILRCPACLGSIFLRFLAFSCKFTKSYFSQTTNATSCATSRMSCWR